MKINELIIKRRSTVLFSSRTIPTDTIRKLFEAARWAPSSRNQQPWKYIYALKNDAFYDELLACLEEKNQHWAKNAPLLLLTIAQVISDYKERKNIYAWHDTGMSYANLVFQATSEGLYVHPMGGYDKEKAKLAAGIPDRFEPVAFAAVGYKSDSDDFDVELIDREQKVRIRKPLEKIVFHGKFGQKSELII